jgi:hypothetical protein
MKVEDSPKMQGLLINCCRSSAPPGFAKGFNATTALNFLLERREVEVGCRNHKKTDFFEGLPAFYIFAPHHRIFFLFFRCIWFRSTMDSISDSDSEDAGSIPAGTTQS